MSYLAKNASNLIFHLLQVRYHSCTKIKCSCPSSNLKDSPLTDIVIQYLQSQTLNQLQLNDTLGSILNNQQSWQRETISLSEMSNNMKMNSSFMTFQCSMENSIDFDEWIVQIDMVSNLTGKP